MEINVNIAANYLNINIQANIDDDIDADMDDDIEANIDVDIKDKHRR
jgi:hypothetical protein